MTYSAYFATRAEHYRKLANRAPNGWQAECQLGLANLFLEMSCDMRLRELAVEATRNQQSLGEGHPATNAHYGGLPAAMYFWRSVQSRRVLQSIG